MLVTHEPKLAARCPRAVRLVDGLVIADGPGREVAMANAEALGAEALAQFQAAERAARVGARPRYGSGDFSRSCATRSCRRRSRWSRTSCGRSSPSAE